MSTRQERNRHFAEKAIDLILKEVDQDGLVGAVAFSVTYGADEIVLYSLDLGKTEVTRAVVVDDALMEAAFDNGTVNATFSQSLE